MNCNTAVCIVNLPLLYNLLVVFEWVYMIRGAGGGGQNRAFL